MTTFFIVVGVVLAVLLVLGVIVVVVMLHLGGTVEAEVYAAINENPPDPDRLPRLYQDGKLFVY